MFQKNFLVMSMAMSAAAIPILVHAAPLNADTMFANSTQGTFTFDVNNQTKLWGLSPIGNASLGGPFPLGWAPQGDEVSALSGGIPINLQNGLPVAVQPVVPRGIPGNIQTNGNLNANVSSGIPIQLNGGGRPVLPPLLAPGPVYGSVNLVGSRLPSLSIP